MDYQDKTKEELIQELKALKQQHDSLKISFEKELSDFKKTEQELIKNRDLLRNLACLVPGVIYQFKLFPDGHSAMPYSSPGINDIYEVTPEDVLEDATPVFNRLHPDDIDFVREAILESARTLTIFYSEFRVTLPIQGIRWHWIQAYPEKMKDGSILWHGIILDTTERKQSEEKLQELVDELKKSQQMAHVGNWKLDLKTGAYSSSDEALRIFGFPLGSFLKIQNISDCIHPDDVERVSNRRDELLQSKERYSIEFRIINKETGQVKNIKSIGEVQCDEENNPIAIIGTLQDITDNKLVLEALKTTHETIEQQQLENETIINSTDDLVWSLDVDLNIIKANEAFRNSTKNYCGRALINGDNILDKQLFPTEMISFWERLYREVLTGKTIHQESHFPSNGNNEPYWLEFILNPIYHGSRIIGIACYGNFITERIEAKKQLTLLSKAIEQSPVSVVITDKNGNIEYVNPKFSALTGYTLEEAKGSNPRILQSGLHPVEFYQKLWSTILSGKEWSGEFYNKKKNGEHYIESAIISPILDAHNEITYFVGVKEDITEKKKMLEDLIKAKEIAEENNNLKTAFLNNISHEIRTPCNGMLGYLSIIQHDELSADEKNEYINIINNSAFRLMNTINDIVEISQIQAGQMKIINQVIDIRQLAEEQFNRFKSDSVNKRIQYNFVYNLSDEITSIHSDGLKLKTIIYNLIDNAFKFTKEGSIEFSVCKIDNNLQFSISDTGIGIPEKHKPTIFDRFMQVDASKTRLFEGLGLGLSISKAYVEMMGGEIWVESEIGKGSTFCFTVPCIITSEIKSVHQKNNKKENAENQHKNLKILIAEDDQTSLDLILYAVKSFTKEILIARNGIEAVEFCRNNSDIDLVLMDIKMPCMDGLEATHLIREFNPDVVIIVQTAFAFMGDHEAALDAGCTGYIAKPLTKNALTGIIKKYF